MEDNTCRERLFDESDQVRVRLYENDRFFSPIDGTLIGREQLNSTPFYASKQDQSRWTDDRYIIRADGMIKNRFGVDQPYTDNTVVVRESSFRVID